MNEFSTDKSSIGQFNLMCNSIWYFHREEYDWHIQKAEGEIDEHLPGSLSVEEWKDLVKDKSLTKPIIRTADHFKWCLPPNYHKSLNNIGYCATYKEKDACTGLEKYDALANCTGLNLGRINETFFRFEKYYSSWTWDPRVNDAYKEHFGSVKKMIRRGYWKYDTKLLDKLIKEELF